MTDFLIVGRGLAATVLMHVFHKNNISFKVIGKTDMSRSSHVAAGIWNPIVFKRLTKSWMADTLIPELNKFYNDCEKLLDKKLTQQLRILKPFTEAQEQELWIKKSKNELDDYLDDRIYSPHDAPKGAGINANFGLVKNCGSLNVSQFLDSSQSFFYQNIIDAVFNYQKLQVEQECVLYEDSRAKNIVFCEGWLVKNNPHFNWLPLKPAKGEILTLQIPQLDLGDLLINRSNFLMPLMDGNFKIGATYEWETLDETISGQAKEDILYRQKLQNDVHVTVLKQEAGVRPSSIDRRPLIGTHPKHTNLFIFNGLGTKGVMLAPYFAIKFVNFYLQKEKLSQEVDIKRFYHLYEAKK